MVDRLRDLGALVRRERTARGIGSQASLAALARIGPRKVSDVERGVAVGPKTYDAIERAFGWPQGGMQTFLETGREPGAVTPAPTPARSEFSEERRRKWRRMTVDEIIERGAEIGEVSGIQARIRYLRAALEEKEAQLSTEDVPQ